MDIIEILRYILLASGIYLVFISVISVSRNMSSRILVKGIPALIGLFNVFMYLMLSGFVNL